MEPLYELLEQYCTACDIGPRTTEQSNSVYQQSNFELAAHSDIVTLLALLRPYIRVQDQAVAVLMEAFTSGLNVGAHSNTEAFPTLKWYVDAFSKQVAARTTTHTITSTSARNWMSLCLQSQ